MLARGRTSRGVTLLVATGVAWVASSAAPLRAQESGSALDAPAPRGAPSADEGSRGVPPAPGYGEAGRAGYGSYDRTVPPPPPSRFRVPDARSAEPRRAPPRYRHMITVDPLALLYGTVSLQYELGIGDHLSLFTGPTLFLYESLTSDLDVDIAAGADLGARIFPTRSARAPQGFWFGPQAFLLWVRQDDGIREVTSFGYAVGGLLGYTWHWGRFVMSIGGGPMYFDIETADGSYEELAPVGRLALGVAF